MPVAKVYTKSQWEAFGRALDALPEKPDTERGVTVRDAMKDMRVRVRTAQAKGYTLDQIAEQAQRHGLDITAGTIRYALRLTGKGSGAGSVARPAPGVRATGAEKAFAAQTRAHDATSQRRPYSFSSMAASSHSTKRAAMSIEASIEAWLTCSVGGATRCV